MFLSLIFEIEIVRRIFKHLFSIIFMHNKKELGMAAGIMVVLT